MKQNKGFSLVEMIVAVTIASAVGVVVFGFMVVGAKAFNSSGADVNVQHEAQLVFNQIQELVVDTNIGIGYDDTTDANQAVLTMYNYDPEDLNKHVYEVVWNKSEEKIYYNEYVPSLKAEGSGHMVEKGASVSTNELLGENIVNFKADTSDLESKRVVRLKMTVRKGSTKYSSSHNITLRNEIIEGSTIPTYIENTPTTVDPEKVVGPENLFAEPGQVLEMQLVGGYKVKAPGGSDYPDQDIRFFLSNDGSYDAGTSVSTSGTLTVSKAQKNDFYVTVATRTGRGAALRVKINLIIVDSVNVTITERDDGKGLNEPLEQNTSFTLKAAVVGRNLDKAGHDMYGITWALADGAEKYVEMGASSPTAGGSNCHFTMKKGFKVEKSENGDNEGKDTFVITATSVRSVQVPYYTGTVQTPVVGTFTGTAYADQGSFQIVSSGSLKRGMHSPTGYVNLVNDLTTRIPGFDSTKHQLFAGVTVNRRTYEQTEDTPSKQYTLEKNVTDSGTEFSEEGANVGITPPAIETMSPHIALEYEITYYIFENKGNDVNDPRNFGNIRIFQPGQVERDGYHINEYKYKSNTVSLFCDRLFLYYNQVHYTGQYNETWIGDYTASLYPRATGNNPNYNNEWNKTVRLFDSDNMRDKGIRDNFDKRRADSFKIYYKKDGSWIHYDDSRRIRSGSGKYQSVASYIGFAQFTGDNLEVKCYEDNWVDDVPQLVRIVPDVKYTENNQDKYAPLFDNYIDVHLWNIKVPVVESYQDGTKDGLFGKAYNKLFFPSPTDPDWPYIQKGVYKEWYHPYPINPTGKQNVSEDTKNKIKNIKLSYYITSNENIGRGPTWYMTLTYRKNGEPINIGYYMCEDDGDTWTAIDVKDMPNNLK